MSYGYPGQGGYYPGQNPPTSFGLPPGTPSSPEYPQRPANPNVGFPNPPVGMPQPLANDHGYGSNSYPSNPSFPQQTHPYRQPMPQAFGHPMPLPSFDQRQSMAQSCFGAPMPQNPMNQPMPTPPSAYSSQPPMPRNPMHQPMSTPPSAYSSQPPMPQAFPRQNQSYGQSPNQMPTNQAYSSPQFPGHHQPAPAQRYPSEVSPGNASYRCDLGSGKMQTGNRPSGGDFRGGHGVSRAPVYGSPVSPSCRNIPPKLSPTVTADPNFDPRSDAEVLRKAMKGWGTDEKAIINVLANRSNSQRQDIAREFKTLYGKDLIEDLKSETSGNFEKILVAMMTPIHEYYAKELHNAISGAGTDEITLIEIMCTMSNYELQVIGQTYERLYGVSLEKDLRDDTSGTFRRLMVSLACGNRDESFNLDADAARRDAAKLLQAGEGQLGTDESTFNAILVQRNIVQLKHIFAEYQNLIGHSIEDAIKNEFSGSIERGLLAIVRVVNDRAQFFAKQLHESMVGAGTEDRRLIRLVVTRSEIDMGEIKEAYAAKYGKSLEKAIENDTSGDYRRTLLALIA